MMGYFDLELLVGLQAALYLMAILNVVRILRQNLSASASLGWIMVNVAFPIIGVPLYFFLGQSKISGYRRLHLRRLAQHPTYKVPATIYPQVPVHSVSELETQSFHNLMGSMDQSFGLTSGEVALMIDGENAFPEIFKAIAAAKRFILVQYYILRNDRLGLELADQLRRKAKQGLKVYLLIDDWGSWGLGRRYVSDLRRSGVEVCRFLPIGLRLNIQINFRNHRKLVLIDGEIAFTGGLNVGVEYLGKSTEGHWRDTHLRISGPALKMLIETFCDDWYFAKKREIFPMLVPLLPKNPQQGTSNMQIINYGPGDNPSPGIMLICHALQQAKDYVWIATPYLIPDTILENALIQAAMRGIEVKVLLPQKGDNHFVHRVSQTYAHQLSRWIQIEFYQPGFMHQKIILADGKNALLGTINFDNRSMYLNFETAVVVHDESVCSQIQTMLANDFASSQTLTFSSSQPDQPALLNRIYRLLGPLF